MLIKDEYQLRIGEIIKFAGQDMQNTSKTRTYDVIVREVYSHWVLGHIVDFYNDDLVLKISMTNVDLVMQGIYPVEAIKENGFNVSIKRELTDEQIEKIKTYNETHRAKL